MATNIDSLSVQIRSNSAGAAKGIDALSASLDKLHKSLAGNGAMSSLAKINQAVKNAGENIGNAPDKIKALASAIDALGRAKTTGISENLAKRISDLSAAVRSLPSNADRKFADLAAGLGSLSVASNARLSSNIGTEIANIGAALANINDTDAAKITSVANALSAFSAIQGIRISGTIANNIFDIGAALDSVKDVDFSRIAGIADALAPLAGIEMAANLGPTLNQLRRLPAIFGELQAMDINAFAEGIQRLVAALRPLAEAVERIGGGLNNLPERMRDLVTNVNRLNGGGGGGRRGGMGGRGFTQILAGLGIAQLGLRSFASTIKEAISSANKYIEDVNLFTASLGKYAAKAKDYADTVSEVMGIDPAKWMRNQGVFMTLASGFGVAGDRAYIMSQQLTQLGYDLSSFFNIAVDGEGGAMQKLQAGIAGELEPLRRLGYDLSQAKLQAIALSQGITKAYNSMTQAEKVQLRYYAIMTQVTTAQGDMARTLNAPANQMRIFSAQLQMAARAIGNIFIPALNAILPYAIAFVKAIRFMAEAVASFFGYSLPEIDYSGLQEVAGGFDDIGGAAGKAAGQAAKLKSYLMGFDELNVIDPTQGGGGGGGSGSGGSGAGSGWDWELPTYDFLGDAVESRVDAVMEKLKPAIEWVKENIDSIMYVITAIGTSIMAWKLAGTFTSALSGVNNLLNKIVSTALAGATLVITAMVVYGADKKLLTEGDWSGLIVDALTTAVGSAVAYRLIKGAFGAEAGLYTASIVLSISALTSLKAIFDHADLTEWSWETAILDLEAVLKATAAGFFAGKAALGVGGGLKGAKAGAAIGLVLSAGVSLKAAFDMVDASGFSWQVALRELEAVLKFTAAGALGSGMLGVSAVKGGLIGAAIGLALTASVDIKAAFNSVDATGFAWYSVMSQVAAALKFTAAGIVAGASLAGGMGAIIGGAAGAAIGLLLTASVDLKAIYNQSKTGDFSWDTAVSSVVAGLKISLASILASGLFGATGGVVLAAGAGGFFLGLALSAAVYLAAKYEEKKTKIDVNWGSVKLSAEEVQDMAESYFTDMPVSATIKLVNATVSDTSAAEDTIAETMAGLTKDLRLIKLGVGVTGTAKDDLIAKITGGESGEGGLISQVEGLLKSRGEGVSLSVSLLPVGTAEADSIVSSWATSSSMITDAMTDWGKKLVEAFNLGQEDEMYASKDLMVQKYLQYITDITNDVMQGRLVGEYKYSTSMALQELDRDSFAAVLETYTGLQDELREKLIQQNKDTIGNLYGQIETLKTIRDQYAAEGDQDKADEYQAMIDSITSQIEYLGSNLNIDTIMAGFTAEGNEKFIEAIKSIFTLGEGEEIDLTDALAFINWEKGIDVLGDEETFEYVRKEIIDRIRQNLDLSDEDLDILISADNAFRFIEWDYLSADAQKELYNSLKEAFGEEGAKQLLKSLGVDVGALINNGVEDGINGRVGGGKRNKKPKDVGKDLGIDIKTGATTALLGLAAAVASSTSSVSTTMWSIGKTTKEKYNEGLDGTPTSTIETPVTLFKDGWTTPDGWVSQYIGGPVQQSVELIKQGWTTIKQFVVNAGVDIVEQAIKLTQHGWTTVDKYTEDHQGTGTVDEGVTLSTDFGSGIDTISEWAGTPGILGAGFVSIETTLTKGWGGTGTTVTDWVKTPSILGAGVVSMSATLSKGWTGTPQSALGIPSSTSITVGLKTDGSVLKLQTTIQGAATTAMTLALQKVTGKANGGYVSTGEMFIAREAGPELVGSIGNRTAVANNDQIVQGIEGGVRTANEDVVAAIYTLIGAVENKDMSVNVGDDAIGRANARYTRKRGVVVNPGAFANSY